jgi:hypothetical protein
MPTNFSQSWMSRIDQWRFESSPHLRLLNRFGTKAAGGGATDLRRQTSFVKSFEEHSNSLQSIPKSEFSPRISTFPRFGGFSWWVLTITFTTGRIKALSKLKF